MGKVVLFYKYTPIEYPKRVLKWQRQICTDLNITGRILIAHEGINGAIGGSDESIERYIEIMRKQDQFADVDFKASQGGADCFPRLDIKVRNEIVHLGLDTQQVTAANSGLHLNAQEVHELLSKNPDDLVILDARNDYEYRIGTFKNAIKPDIGNFRELPEYIDSHLDQFKDKQVLMYCTYGVRCERASSYLKSTGVTKEVMQVKGGIGRYVEQYPDGFFRGKNYVFDARVAIPVNNDVLTTCDLCPVACDDYTNCVNASCNNHYIACQQCLVTYDNMCSAECQAMIASGAAKKRVPFVKVPTESLLNSLSNDSKDNQ